MAKRPTDTDSNVNRVRGIADDIIGIKDPDDIMIALLEVLTEQPKTSVQPGQIYIFVYNAKTPQLRYDQNPFVAVTDIMPWGFRGINFHWDEPRQYTWAEVAGGVYEYTIRGKRFVNDTFWQFPAKYLKSVFIDGCE